MRRNKAVRDACASRRSAGEAPLEPVIYAVVDPSLNRPYSWSEVIQRDGDESIFKCFRA